LVVQAWALTAAAAATQRRTKQTAKPCVVHVDAQRALRRYDGDLSRGSPRQGGKRCAPYYLVEEGGSEASGRGVRPHVPRVPGGAFFQPPAPEVLERIPARHPRVWNAESALQWGGKKDL